MDPTVEPSLFQTLAPYIDKALLGFISLLLTGALELGRRHLGMAQTQVSQDAVNKAAASMTEAIMRKYGATLQRYATVTNSDPAVMEAADYVQRRLPDSLKQLEMDTADVRDLMTTRINAGLAHTELIELPVPAPAPSAPVAAPVPKPAPPPDKPEPVPPTSPISPAPPAFPPDPAMPTEVAANDQTAETQIAAELKVLFEKHPNLLKLLKEIKT